MDSTRRTFLQSTGITVGLATPFAGCLNSSGGSNASSGGSKSSQLSNKFKLAGTLPDPSEVNRMLGVKEIAKKQNNRWNVPIKQAGSSDIIVQTMLSGQTMGGNIGGFSAFPIIEKGQSLQAVGGYTGVGDYVLVTQPDIKSMKDIVEQNATIGMNAPSGLEVLLPLAVMLNRGLVENINDLNLQQIGFSSARVGAMISGDIDVSAQHYNQWLDMKEEKPELNNLLIFQEELDQWLGQLFWTTPQNYKEYQNEWIAILKSVTMASRRLYDGFDIFQKAVKNYVPGEESPDENVLKKVYDFNVKYNVWPKNGDMSKQSQEFGIDLAKRAEITDKKLDPNKVFDRSALDKALDDIGRV